MSGSPQVACGVRNVSVATANEGDVTLFDKRHGTAFPPLGRLKSLGAEGCMRMPIYEHNMVSHGEKCVKLRIVPNCMSGTSKVHNEKTGQFIRHRNVS